MHEASRSKYKKKILLYMYFKCCLYTKGLNIIIVKLDDKFLTSD